MILTPGLILVLPESGLPLVNHPHNIGSPPNNHVHSRTMVSCPSRPCDLLSVPSWQMEDGSTVTVLFSLVLSFLLLEHSETGGQLSSPQLLPSRAPLLVRLLLLLFPNISPPVSPLRYGMVGTVAGDGAPRSLSVFRSSGVCWTRPRSLRGFCGSLLSFAVLAGLLPQLTTFDHCFTVSLSSIKSKLHLVYKTNCSKPLYTKFTWLGTFVANC